jgi:hypothetical protein
MSDNYRPHFWDEMTKAMDPYVHAITAVAEVHRMSHDGFMHHVSGKQTGIANAASAEFLMVVPADVRPHITRVELDVGAGDVDLLMYEGTTTSADGTALTSKTTNRNSIHTPGCVAYGGPTVTGDGTQFHQVWAPPTSAGVGQKVGIMNIALGEEWVLQPSTKYLFRITNNSGGTISLGYEFVWYEVAYQT